MESMIQPQEQTYTGFKETAHEEIGDRALSPSSVVSGLLALCRVPPARLYTSAILS